MDVGVIILAAGKGKRMNSDIPKVLHQVLGRPMISYVLDAVRELKFYRIAVVTGYKSKLIRDYLSGENIYFAYQGEQLGTGNAALCAKYLFDEYDGDVLILNGDLPMLRPETLTGLVSCHKESGAAVTLLTTVIDDPKGYGRVTRNAKGAVTGIVEHRDATAKQRKIREINAGAYCVKTEFLWNALEALNPSNTQHEYYLPDIVHLAIEGGGGANAVPAEDGMEVLGVNDRRELAAVEGALRRRTLGELMDSGVTIVDPHTTYISPQASIGIDSVIYPNTYILGRTAIGWGSRIGPTVWIEDSTIGHDVVVNFCSHIRASTVNNGATIGPFANLRPNSAINSGARIGNFVEIKNSRIGHGTKVPHLSYVGDAVVGDNVNIGAGTITCNYDGFSKHTTVIEDNAFIGSDTMLVAPVKVGKRATTGAGSTITEDVPPDSLALGRAKQTVIRDWERKPPKNRAKESRDKAKG